MMDMIESAGESGGNATVNPAFDFARSLRGYRLRAGLTQRELADRAGVSVASVRDLEQRRTLQPHPASLRRIAVALGLSSEEADEMRRAITPSALATAQVTPSGGEDLSTIAVLGPLLIRRGPTMVALGANRQRAMLGRLALSPNTAVPRSELVEALWGESAPSSAIALIQSYATRLRRLLQAGPVQDAMTLRSTPGGYRLELGEDNLDLLRFRRLVGTARSGLTRAAASAADVLEAALSLWRGEPVADIELLRDHPLAIALGNERIEIVLLLADLADATGEYDRALPWLRRLSDVHPLHEPLRGRLILALAANGQQAAALSAYDETRARLVDELGIDPGPELDQYRQRVLRQEWTLPAIATRQAPTSALLDNAVADSSEPARSVPFQTPATVADFTGRREILDRLCALLDRDPAAPAPPAIRVCVIAGVGGVGKTTVAVQAAHLLRSRFPDGQLYIDMHGFRQRPVQPVEALSHFLRALGVAAAQIPADQVGCEALYRSALDGRRVLVIIDNAGMTRHVRALLPGSGGSAVIVTSRRRLVDLEGGQVLDLDMMADTEALDLLSDVAGPARVAAEPAAAAAVVDACGRLPLAIRIAGARLASRSTWTVDTLAQRLGNQQRRLDELRAGDLEIRATFQLSYGGLPPRPARAFRMLALAPVVEINTAATMLDYDKYDLEDDLDMLVDAGLLEPVGPGRFQYHDLVRLFAAKLAAEQDSAAERDAALRRLLDFYLARVAAAAWWQHPNMVRLPLEPKPEPHFADCDQALAWLREHLDDVVAAITHAADHGPYPLSWQLADQLRGYFFSERHLPMWLASGEAGLRAASRAGDQRAVAAMRQTLGQAYWSVGDYPRSLTEYELGRGLARETGWVAAEAYLLHNIGLVQLALGRRADAHRSYLQSLEVCRAAGLDYVQAVTLNDLGMMCWELGELDDAARYLSDALELNRRQGNLDGQSVNRLNLATVQREMGRFDDARVSILESHQLSKTRYNITAIHDELSQVCIRQGDLTEAIRLANEALEAARAIDDRPFQAGVLATLGTALLAAGETDEAADRLTESYELACSVAAPYTQARALTELAAAETRRGDHTIAARHAARALGLARDGGYRMLEADALLALASTTATVADRRELFDSALNICIEGRAMARVDQIRQLLKAAAPKP